MRPLRLLRWMTVSLLLMAILLTVQSAAAGSSPAGDASRTGFPTSVGGAYRLTYAPESASARPASLPAAASGGNYALVGPLRTAGGGGGDGSGCCCKSRLPCILKH